MVKKILTYLVIVGIAALSAVNYELFIFPNQFAPAGLNGLCTMFQYVTNISMGYLSLLLNIPLAIAVYCKVSRTLAIRAMLYVGVFSVLLMVFQKMDLSNFQYVTENGTSTIMGPLVAGIINGAGCAVLLKASAYSGGTDFVASLIHKVRPDYSFFWTGFAINILVACLSFFVYGYRIEPVLLCVLYCFSYSLIMDKMNKSGRTAIRFEIITKDPEGIANAIIHKLHHGATVIPATGVYKGQPTNIIICVVNKTQSALLASLIREHPGTFAVVSQATEVVGNFKKLDNKGMPAPSILDEGEGNGL